MGVTLHEVDLLLLEAATKGSAFENGCAAISATEVEPDKRTQDKECNESADDHRCDRSAVRRGRWIDRGRG